MKPNSSLIIDQLIALNAMTDVELQALPTSEVVAFLTVVGGVAGQPSAGDPNFAIVSAAYTRLSSEVDARRQMTGLVFGDDSVGSDAGSRFLNPGYGNNSTSPTAAISITAPRGGTLRNLFVRHHAFTNNANKVTYTVQVNGVDTALVATLPVSAVATASNVVDTTRVAQGDRITIKVTKSGSIGGNSSLKAVASVEIS